MGFWYRVLVCYPKAYYPITILLDLWYNGRSLLAKQLKVLLLSQTATLFSRARNLTRARHSTFEIPESLCPELEHTFQQMISDPDGIICKL